MSRKIKENEMKKLLALLLFAPAMLFAQSPWNGTWVTKVDTAQLSKKPEVYSLQNGTYRCSTCVPAIDLKADGADHAVTGSHYFDMVSVRVVDANTVEITDKKDGKTVYWESDTVSPDGRTLTQKFKDQTSGNPEPVTGEETLARVSKGPAGSASISGSWRAVKIGNMSSNGLTVTYEATADGLKMSTPTGQSYDAKFDGKNYPIQGDPGHTMVKVEKTSTASIVEFDQRDGKIVSTFHMTIAKDGKSIKAVFDDKERNTKITFTMYKQS
jgi:hypothetical protein